MIPHPPPVDGRTDGCTRDCAWIASKMMDNDPEMIDVKLKDATLRDITLRWRDRYRRLALSLCRALGTDFEISIDNVITYLRDNPGQHAIMSPIHFVPGIPDALKKRITLAFYYPKGDVAYRSAPTTEERCDRDRWDMYWNLVGGGRDPKEAETTVLDALPIRRTANIISVPVPLEFDLLCPHCKNTHAFEVLMPESVRVVDAHVAVTGFCAMTQKLAHLEIPVKEMSK